MARLLKFGEYQKLVDAITPYKCQCKECGRKKVIGVNSDRVLCDWCGHYIYKNDELEFKYKMQEALRKGEKNGQ